MRNDRRHSEHVRAATDAQTNAAVVAVDVDLEVGESTGIKERAVRVAEASDESIRSVMIQTCFRNTVDKLRCDKLPRLIKKPCLRVEAARRRLALLQQPAA